MQQEAEHVEQEEDADAVEVGEESLVVDDWQLVGAHVADNVRHTDDDQQHGIHQAGDDEQRRPMREKVGGTKTGRYRDSAGRTRDK